MAKILIAEDEKDIRDLIAFTLRFAGNDVTLASDGAEALAMARSVSPDLVMLDVRMPKLTGYDVCRALKADAELNAVPVVFVSAKGQENEIEEGYSVGAARYILKPFTPDLLVETVNELLAPVEEADAHVMSATSTELSVEENETSNEGDATDERPNDQ